MKRLRGESCSAVNLNGMLHTVALHAYLLAGLIHQVKATLGRMPWGSKGPPPLLVKIAPDLTELDKADIAAVATSQKVDGLIVSNTTIQRPGDVAKYPQAQEAGGLSGRPLFDLATKALSDMYRLTGGR